MIFARLRFWHILPSALLAAVALVPAGCGPEEGVSKTQVPKTSELSRPQTDELATGKYRILGAMFPVDEPKWFFKLVGPADALAAYEAGFDQLLASVSLPANGGTPEFTPPEGWARGPGREMVAVTVKTPDGKYEVTVASAMGGVAENLKRWATAQNQLGNARFTGADVAKYTKTIDARGVKGLRADLRGPNDPTSKRGPFMGGGKPPGHP
jgi:hypothetical protein